MLWSTTIDLKIDNLDKVSIPTEIGGHFVAHQFLGRLMAKNDDVKSVNIDRISAALHVYYLNLIVS